MVAWVGYGDEDQTWEPEPNLSGASRLLAAFKKMKNGKRTVHTPTPKKAVNAASKKGWKVTATVDSASKKGWKVTATVDSASKSSAQGSVFAAKRRESEKEMKMEKEQEKGKKKDAKSKKKSVAAGAAASAEAEPVEQAKQAKQLLVLTRSDGHDYNGHEYKALALEVAENCALYSASRMARKGGDSSRDTLFGGAEYTIDREEEVNKLNRALREIAHDPQQGLSGLAAHVGRLWSLHAAVYGILKKHKNTL